MSVKAGGNDHQVGSEFRRDLFDGRIESAPLIARRGHGSQRYIQVVTTTPPLSRFSAGTGTRIPWILMHRKVEDRRIVVEDALRAVTVMHVPVEDRDALDVFVSLLGVARRHGDIVENTKTHGPIRRGVMSRRPHRDKGIPGSAFDYQIDRLT